MPTDVTPPNNEVLKAPTLSKTLKNKAHPINKPNKTKIAVSPKKSGNSRNAVAQINKSVIDQKADISDLVALNDMKTNKVDTEMLMNCVDILHK